MTTPVPLHAVASKPAIALDAAAAAGPASRTRGGWSAALIGLVLSHDRRQQVRLAQSLLANALMLGSVGVCFLLDAAGVADSRWMALWTACSVGGLVVVFAMIRSGMTLRWRDPSLTMLQMVYAVLCAGAAYWIDGAERAVVIPILAVILMFGMFGMTRSQVGAVSLLTLAVFGTVSALHLHGARTASETPIELSHLLMLCIVLAGSVILTGRLQQMRERSRAQRAELASALERIGQLATQDDLTGCMNRRAMLERLQAAADAGQAHGPPLCVALIDVDHFKRINDSFGHAAGDAVLRRLPAAARQQLRQRDVLARWGGEEFLLLLPDTDLADAQACVQRLIDGVAEQPFAVAGDMLRITCSAGVAQLRRGESLTLLIDRADRAMYGAKQSGRNRLQCG